MHGALSEFSAETFNKNGLPGVLDNNFIERKILESENYKIQTVAQFPLCKLKKQT